MDGWMDSLERQKSKTGRRTDRQKMDNLERQKRMDGWMDSLGSQTEKETGRRMNRQTEKWMDGWMDRQFRKTEM